MFLWVIIWSSWCPRQNKSIISISFPRDLWFLLCLQLQCTSQVGCGLCNTKRLDILLVLLLTWWHFHVVEYWDFSSNNMVTANIIYRQNLDRNLLPSWCLSFLYESNHHICPCGSCTLLGSTTAFIFTLSAHLIYTPWKVTLWTGHVSQTDIYLHSLCIFEFKRFDWS